LRTKTNKELDELIKHWNMINYVKSQRLSWCGHKQNAGNKCCKEKYINGNHSQEGQQKDPSPDGKMMLGMT
jgi:hypothetical protein